jgi:hypothetical protein
MLGEGVTMAEPAVVQSGQRCEPVGSSVRSAQKWNCAVRKTIPRSNAKQLLEHVLPGMCLMRRSLGKKGCGVNETPVPRLLGRATTGSAVYADTLSVDTSGANVFPFRNGWRLMAAPREIRFGFGQLRAVRARIRDGRELGVKGLCGAQVSGGLRGMTGAVDRIEAVGGIL